MKRTCYISLLIAFVLGWAAPVLAQLQPETVRQIQSLLDEKSSRSPVQQKIASQLLQGVREFRGQKMVADVNLEKARLNTDNSGNLKVDIIADVNDQLLAKIKAAGGVIIYTSVPYRSIRAEINTSKVETIAAYPEVKFIKPAAASETVGTGAPGQAVKNRTTATTSSVKGSGGLPLPRPSLAERSRRVRNALKKYLQERDDYNPLILNAGSVNSQGDRAHRADDTRNAFGYAGQGIRIGVLSDSYNSLGTAPADVASGNLPGAGNPYGNTTPVTVLADIPNGSDEGRAMLQIVHDLAPKAQLFYATAFSGSASFATNIQALRNAPYNCDIIIDDVSYSDEPVFQDGIIAQAVNTVTASGGLYFSSAGNAGSLAKNTSGVWEGDFNDTGAPVFTGSTKTGSIHNFGTVAAPLNGDSILAAGSRYSLQWADPFGASANDYDLFLVSATGTVKASSTNIQTGTQNPDEEIVAPALVAGDRLVVFKTAAAQVRAFAINAFRGRFRIGTTGQTHGHSAAVDAYSVAATPAVSPGVFVSSNQVETFSSDGLRRIFFNANGTAITPGNFLFGTNGGTVRNKPDVTAADGVSTTLPPGGLNPFFGTSAAAPHAGAIAGLLKSANPALTPAQIRTILTTTALDIESPGYDNVSGFGILQTYQAMTAVSPTPLPYINIGAISTAEGSYNNGNGSVDPGELGNLIVQLNNSSFVNATNVTATVTTTTPGVTITRGTASYGTINTGSSAANTATPFVFAVNSSVACGSVITFQVTASFSGGAGSNGSTVTITLGQLTTIGNISATLGGTPPTGAGYTTTSGQQTGRLVRGATASSCAAPIANPGLTVTTGARQYDAYTFTNTTGASQCYTTTLTSPNGANIYTVAYNSNGFVPANPSTNYLAQPGQSATTQTYSFNVAAGATFTVVVHDVNVTPASNSPYTLTVTYIACAARPACTPVSITTSSIATGATGTPYVQRFSATGGSGNYSYSIAGNLPAGLSVAGDSLYGTPTQAGSFAITVTANDLTGCPGGTASYTLVIAGNAPASVVATAGTPQTTKPSTAFATALQATVYDASNAPLSGVNVMFTAPTSGASGTFAGGSASVTVTTNASGVATAPTFTANATQGSYTVTASVNGVSTAASFGLSNICPSTLVTTNADSGPGSLRAVVANACPGATITFSSGITSIVLTSGDIPITQATTITGPGANLLSISGSNLSRIFNITAGTSTVTISGLTIKDGKPQPGMLTSNSQNGGGGILLFTGALNLTNCVFSNNDASLTGYAEGGGLDNEGPGIVTVTGCSFINNKAQEDGGGIAHWGGARMTITNSTVFGNAATGGSGANGDGFGGGIFSYSLMTLTNSTVYGNTGYNGGGNIYRSTSTLTMGNTLIGGGVLTGSTATAANGRDVYAIAGLNSTGYNLIQNTGGYVISGITTGNQLGVNPKVFPLGNYGGITPTCLPMSNSPAVNAGDPALTTGTDQRGTPRYVGGRADIGAVETNYASSTTSGTPQTALINTLFSLPLQATVKESGNLIAGDTVVFTAPVTSASGTFPGASLTDTVVTNAGGIATSRAFTANGIAGIYDVTASIGTALPAINFALTNATPLPVVFGNMSASAGNCMVQLQWKTLTELNTRNFTIEYSADGLVYNSIAVIPAKGNSNTVLTYNYTHTSPAKGNVYYRIRQADADGTYLYSKVLSAVNSCNKGLITVYPNPAKDKLTIQVAGTARQAILVYDATGRLMTRISISGGTHEIAVSSWAKGVYTLTVVQENKEVYTLKVVKE